MHIRTLAAALLSTASVMAAETNTVTDTVLTNRPTILITATRMSSDQRRIPGNPTIINSPAQGGGVAASVPEVLSRGAGLHTRRYADNPSQASVDIRGFGENSHGRVLVLMNGRRINRPDLAPVNWSQIPLRSVERIEVFRGPRTALYGDYAVGGVINIITRRGQEQPRTELGLTLGSYGFNDENISTAGEFKGTGYYLFAGHQSADGYRDRSAYDTWSGSLNLEQDLGNRAGLWLDYAYVRSDYELPGSLSQAQLQQDRRQSVNPDDDASEAFHNIGFGAGYYPNDTDEWIIDFGYSRKEIESNISSFFSFNTWSIDTYSASPKVHHESSVFRRDNRLTLGVDAGYDDLAIDRYGDRAHTVRNGSSGVGKQTAAVYGHDEISLLEMLILSGGARAEQARYSIRERDGSGAVVQDTSDTHKVSAYDLGLTWLPVEPLKLYARYDRLYRLPFVDEQISYQGFGSGFNKELDPETGDAYEVGIGFSPSGSLSLQGALFRMDMQDEIAYAVTNFTTFQGANFNMDDTRHQGMELSARWQPFDSLGLHADYTLQDVKYTAGPNKGNRVPLVPEHLLSAGFDFALMDPLHLLADAVFTGEQYAGSAADNSPGTELDAYTVVNVALRYSLKVRKTDLRLFAGIDNLFSEEYSPMAYGGFGTIYAYYPAPERTYKAGIEAAF